MFNVSTEHYEEAHMKRPGGTKIWEFDVRGEIVSTDEPMKYGDAKKWLRKNHVERGEVLTAYLMP